MTTPGSAPRAMIDPASDYAPDSAAHHLLEHALRPWPHRFTIKYKLPNKTTNEKGISKCRLLFPIGVSIPGCCCARP